MEKKQILFLGLANLFFTHSLPSSLSQFLLRILEEDDQVDMISISIPINPYEEVISKAWLSVNVSKA